MSSLSHRLTRVLGLDPVAVPPEVFALEGGELRYARFEHGLEGATCTASRAESLPLESWPDGPLGSPFHDTAMLEDFVDGFLAHLGEVPRTASLVLPDNWIRLTFAELAELPRGAVARDQILRWKLKRLVPFKVEELRVSALEVTPFPGQDEPHRLLLGFSIEALLDQLESVFSGCGVTLGHVTNASMAALPLVCRVHARQDAWQKTDFKDLGVFVVAVGNTYSVTCFRDNEPLVYRFKSLVDRSAVALPATPDSNGKSWYDERECESIRRELRLTSRFLQQHFPDLSRPSVFVSASSDSEPMWVEFIEQELGGTPFVLTGEQLGLIDQTSTEWAQTAPLLGATMLEVD